MTNFNNAQNLYKNAWKELDTSRDLEYRVFSEVTADLIKANRKGEEAYVDLVHALYRNQRLWQLLELDLISPNNKLDLDLKRKLLNLAKFIETHTQKVLKKEAAVNPIIDINKTIMDGLSASIMNKKEE